MATNQIEKDKQHMDDMHNTQEKVTRWMYNILLAAYAILFLVATYNLLEGRLF